jgi:hypothetical protein
MGRAPRRVGLPRPRDRIRLGESLRVSPFLQGMTFSDPGVIGAAFDAGINFFLVSADLHWPHYASSREGLARLFRRRPRVRDRVVVAAISYVVDPPTAGQAYDELLESVPGLDRIDLLMAGMVRPEEVALRLTGLASMAGRQAFGARASGATFHLRATAIQAQRDRLVDLVCLRHNPRHPRGLTDAFPKVAADSPTRLFVFKTSDGLVEDDAWPSLGLSRDHWRPRPPDYYRFALGAPGVDGVLLSLGKRRHVRELEEAMRAGRLDQEGQQYLIDLARRATLLGLYPPIRMVYGD